MTVSSLRNISLRDCRKFLTKAGCKNTRTKGGHEVWTRADLLRPIIIQTHIDPVPERIIKQIISALDLEKEDFFDMLNS